MQLAEFDRALAALAGRVNEALDRLLPAARDDRLADAMRYASLQGGKRLRPFVLVSAASLFDVPEHDAMPAACALECVHAFSLVHDDLPALDDDDLRRGRPTLHRAFDEATAVLAGDSLLTLSFQLVAEGGWPPEVRSVLVAALAKAVGRWGMIGGQMADLAAEGRFAADRQPIAFNESATLAMQEMKTGALFRVAAEAGAILAQAPAEDRTRLAQFGRALGLAFQIADDLLDEQASTEELGKATAKDRSRGKATLVAALGPEQARQRLDELVEQACAEIAPFGTAAEPLAAAARFAAARRH